MTAIAIQRPRIRVGRRWKIGKKAVLGGTDTKLIAKLNTIYKPYLSNTARTQIYFGGASSGKSVFNAQRFVLAVMDDGRNVLVCRAVARTIRKSVFAEIRSVINEFDLEDEFHVHKSEMVITHKANGHQILFAGLDDVNKLKSIRAEKGAITDVWVEEATEIQDIKDIKQLMRRQRGGDPGTPKTITLTFNPLYQSHPIYKEYFEPLGWHDNQTEYNSDSLTILKTWYIHNEYLTQGDIDDLENEPDGYFKDVYTYGKWGILGNVIFTNWRVEDLSGLRGQFTTHRHGLYFGFSNDPAALPYTHYDKPKKRIYIYDEFYEVGMTNDVLAASIKAPLAGSYVKADSAEPKSIAELNKHGVRVVGAKKGKDSVLHGIQWLQQQEIIIDKSCVHSISEFQQYQWKKDKHGDPLPQPVDKNNHIIDGLRYAYEDDMTLQSGFYMG